MEAFHTPIKDIYKFREIIKPDDHVQIRGLEIPVSAADIFA